jgi:hypothetical protein
MLGHVPAGTLIHGVIAEFFAVATMMVRLWTGPSGPPVATTELGSVTDMLLAEDLLLLVTDDASGCRRCRARRREPPGAGLDDQGAPVREHGASQAGHVVVRDLAPPVTPSWTRP